MQRHRVADEAEKEVPADVLARGHVDIGREEMPVPLVVVVHVAEGARQPVAVRLGEVDAQVRKALEDARCDQLDHRVRGRVIDSMSQQAYLGVGVRNRRTCEERLIADPEVNVRRYRHADAQGGLPEPVVLGLGHAAAVRELGEGDCSQAQLPATLELGDCVVEA